MNIIEIAEGTITLELQPEEAMDIARACGHVLALDAVPRDENLKDHDYLLYRAIFQSLAVAANAQYCIVESDELASTSLSALSMPPQRTIKRERSMDVAKEVVRAIADPGREAGTM